MKKDGKFKIRKSQKGWPPWLRWGIIFGGIYLIVVAFLFLIFMFEIRNVNNESGLGLMIWLCIIQFPVILIIVPFFIIFILFMLFMHLENNALLVFIIVPLIGLIGWFILGSLVGLVFGKKKIVNEVKK